MGTAGAETTPSVPWLVLSGVSLVSAGSLNSKCAQQQGRQLEEALGGKEASRHSSDK